MAKKDYIEVMVGGKVYELGGAEDREYLERVATYVNSKISELRRTSGFLRQSVDNQQVSTLLNLADDYFQEKERADSLAQRVEELEREVESLRSEKASWEKQRSAYNPHSVKGR